MVVWQRRRASVENVESEKLPNDFKAFYIIIFSNTAKAEVVSWIIELITRTQFDGGAELLVHRTNTEEGIILEIGAEAIRLLQGAETLEIMKEDKQKNIREFVFSDIHQFLKPGDDINDLLSTSEKQRIVLEEIMGIRAMEKKKLIGYQNIQLFPGQSVVQVCKNNGIIECIFPLHESSELKALKNRWTFTVLPLGEIRNYFGESVAFYFAFICFYTWALSVPAIIGVLQTVISFDISRSYVIFATIKMIWLTVFLEMWKRKSNELAYTWGTLKLVTIPKLHPTFRGRYMDKDPVTKQYIPIYPGYKRHLKVYCGSLPVVILCLILAFIVMLVYFRIEKYVISIFDDGSLFGWIVTQIPGVIYAILVYVMNVGYSYIAYILTEWENHKLQESFDNHRIVKMLLFEFVNNFIAMGYIAFYEQDMSMLKWQICVMMVVNQLVNQFQEALLPFLLRKYRKIAQSKDFKSFPHRIRNILEQRDLWAYEGTYDDYLELFMQFGYVFLFSAVFPLAASLAIINNVTEVWTDGFKLCYAYQRPQARPIKGIGIWQLAFEVLSLLSVMSNCALISMSPVVRSYSPEMSMCSWLLVAVAVEHVIIAVKMIMSYLISDTPKWVKVAIQRNQYESLRALKLERQHKFEIVKQSLNLTVKKND